MSLKKDNKKKRVLSVLGAYDRYNYGDLLFPHIIEKELLLYYDNIKYYATTQSDLTKVGGKKTESIRSLSILEAANNNTLLIAGGESLLVSWGILCTYLSPYFHKLYSFSFLIKKLFGDIITYKIYNYIGRIWMNGNSYLPLCFHKGEIKNIDNVYCNSLGGSGLNDFF